MTTNFVLAEPLDHKDIRIKNVLKTTNKKLFKLKKNLKKIHQVDLSLCVLIQFWVLN